MVKRNPSAIVSTIITVIIIHHSQLYVVELTAPLNWLGNGAGGCYRSVGGVCVGGGDVAAGAEYFAHVLGEIKTVGVPCTVFLDGKGAGGDGPGGILGDESKTRVVATGEVDAGDLQVTTVQVALVQRNDAIHCNHLEAAASHAVVGAGNYSSGSLIGEADGAVLCIVDGRPNAGLGLDARLVAIGIEDGREAEACFIL